YPATCELYTPSLHDALPISILKDDVESLAEDNEFYLYFNNENSYYTSYNVENHTKDMSDALAGCYEPVKYNYKTKTLQYNTEFRSEEHTSELQSRENIVCRL